MYTLANLSTYHRPSREESYILDIQRISAGLVSISSDQHLSLFDPAHLERGPLSTSTTAHENLSGLRVFDAENGTVCTAGENGEVGVWDLRGGGKVAQFKASSSPILSMACDAPTKTIAVGTELQNHAVSIYLWDVRSNPSSKATYTEVHSDDITTLSFHPVVPTTLLSGSTDGLVNIYDTLIPDEDDLVVQTFNHNASIHHAAFLTSPAVAASAAEGYRYKGTEVVALSHDEQFAVYDMAEEAENGAASVDFGDLRGVLDCQYVADVMPKLDGSGAIVGAGAQDREMFELVFLTRSQGSWAFDRENSVGLPGAHGQEIVRSFCFYDEQQVVFTGGEDGKIKGWRPSS